MTANQYLACRSTGAELVDVHGAIGAYADDDGTLQAVWLVGHDGRVYPVSVDDVGDGEYEISQVGTDGQTNLIEYVLYDEDGDVDTHNIHIAA